MTSHPYKAALITGAGKRIGRTLALALAADGLDIIVHHRGSQAEAQSVVDEIRAMGRKAACLSADLASTTETKALLPAAADLLGQPIDVLVNNASVFTADTLETLTEESWQTHQSVNLQAPLMLTQALAKALRAGQPGLVINIIDQRVLKLNPLYMSYTASKAGLWTITRTTAQALAEQGIRVNAISPGPTLPNSIEGETGFYTETTHLPLGYGPQLSEFSSAIHFMLISPSLTGQMITLDSGQHLAWRTSDIPED